MAFKISGFGAGTQEKKEMIPTYQAESNTIVPRKSLVQIRFPGKGMALPTVDNLIVLAALLNVRIDDILVTTVA